MARGTSIIWADLSMSENIGYLSAPMGLGLGGGATSFLLKGEGVLGRRALPPGTSTLPVMAQRERTARMLWTPQLEYSRPVYMVRPAGPWVARIRASSRMVSAGTPVMPSATSGRKFCTYLANSGNPWVQLSTKSSL